ncbi:MAG: 30S ribosomal protein S12 methylthiotransferase RimO [Planctomycetota bacterium]|jgi:ribosomal protein S12 methylthiotransferase|nr:30S ribosomal protein S12 methylthiotransferase RimO [Planctomycetota bacterium]
MAKIFMTSLGCAKNLVDAEIALGGLLGDEHELALAPDMADVILVNTCGFIQSARDEAFAAIEEFIGLKRAFGGGILVAVMGCLAQRDPDQILRRFPELDAVWGLGVLGNIGGAMRDLLSSAPRPRKSHFDSEKYIFSGPRLVSTPSSFSYLKIADGCDNRCNYCAIPEIRGRMRSRSSAEILDEAKAFADRGMHELVIVAQDTTLYGKDLDGSAGLGSLLEKLLRTIDIPRIRILYAHPAHIGEDVAALLLSEPRLCGYLDLPVQHVSDRMLAAMGRGYGKDRVIDLCERFGGADFTLRTTLLTGFPGEKEADFLEMLDVVRSRRFKKLGVFAYSPEKGTPAFGMPDQVPAAEAERRRGEVLLCQRKAAFEWLDSRIGGEEQVLIDRDRGDGWSEGRTIREAPDADGVILLRGAVSPGMLVNACITGRNGYDLVSDPGGKAAGKHRRDRARRRARR